MSFRIFAAGTHKFRYTQDNCADGDIFEAARIMSAMRAIFEPTAIGAAAGAVDYVSPNAMRESEFQAKNRLKIQFIQFEPLMT